MAEPTPPPAQHSQQPPQVTRVQVSTTVSDLSKKCNILVHVNITDSRTNGAQRIGSTEMHKGVTSANFTEKIALEYHFWEQQVLRFDLVNVENDQVSEQIGKVETTMGDIFASEGNQKTFEVWDEGKKTKKVAKLTIALLELKEPNSALKFVCTASNLQKMDFFGKSDPYFVVKRANTMDSNVFSFVYQSEVLKKTLDPKWKQFTLQSNVLCGNEPTMPIKIEVWDWNAIQKHSLIGEFVTSVKEIREKRNFSLHLSADSVSKGQFNFETFEETATPTFLDFIYSGTEIQMVFGVDWTISNKDPSETDSLHCLKLPEGRLNEYESAIRLVGDILAPYACQNQRFPAFGFGARAKEDNSTKAHCFPLNGNEKDPACDGVNGVLSAYRKAHEKWELYGPTNFAPILDKCAAIAEAYPPGEKYMVVVMITDGEISDLDETIDIVAKISGLPMSIVIIGVGSENFAGMKTLDDDTNQIKRADPDRDPVQFVPFRKFANISLADLAKETLTEVPSQFLSYCRRRSIVPKKWQPISY